MSRTWVCFGDPNRLQLCLRWAEDPTPTGDRPAHGGWSAGEVRIIVGGHNLTSHRNGGRGRDAVSWYLLPLFEWLARNWVSLLHEEYFTWRENTAASAASATFLATRRLFYAASDIDKATYRDVQVWRSRHALRAADPGALYPDIFVRRLRDDVEVSWTARQPSYAPNGFRLQISPGAASLSVADVASPLWEALAWAVSTAPTTDVTDHESRGGLERAISALDGLGSRQLAEAYLRPSVLGGAGAALAGRAGLSFRMDHVPAVTALDEAVLMFGGISPQINAVDAGTLVAFLDGRLGRQEEPALSGLVNPDVGPPLAGAYSEGYDLAEDLLEELGIRHSAGAVDIGGVLGQLGVEVLRKALCTDSVRGAAVAGPRHGPAILVNMTSAYNQTEGGERFTLAHELCHILYDRSRARRVAHTSGPWAEPGVERRANAFAAMFLMPRESLRLTLATAAPDGGEVARVAALMRVSRSALVEHLYNTDMIDEPRRDALRAEVARDRTSR